MPGQHEYWVGCDLTTHTDNSDASDQCQKLDWNIYPWRMYQIDCDYSGELSQPDCN